MPVDFSTCEAHAGGADVCRTMVRRVRAIDYPGELAFAAASGFREEAANTEWSATVRRGGPPDLGQYVLLRHLCHNGRGSLRVPKRGQIARLILWTWWAGLRVAKS